MRRFDTRPFRESRRWPLRGAIALGTCRLGLRDRHASRQSEFNGPWTALENPSASIGWSCPGASDHDGRPRNQFVQAPSPSIVFASTTLGGVAGLFVS